MENLNKNLHFVVFGAGVLLGIIFLGVGMFIRSGTESQLAEQEKALEPLTKAGAVPTEGNLDVAKERSDRFDGSLTAADSALRGPGSTFISFDRTFSDGLQFYSEEAKGKLSQLQTRFAALEKKELALPALLTGWTFAAGGSKSDPWAALDKDMANPPADRIREMQMRLRMLDELVTTLEKLIETGAGDGFGVKVNELKFPSPFGPSVSSEVDSPWMVLPFEIELECSPALGILLVDELANPTQRTLTATTSTDPAKPAGYTRLGFPVLVEMMQTVMLGRQPEMRYQILNEDKPGVLTALNAAMIEGEPKLPVPPDPQALDPEKPEGQKVVEEAIRNLNEKDRMVLPVQFGLRVKAASFNSSWRAVKAPEANE
jgi:hypothetical protein